jgi:O-antigen biosynthesis protein
LTPRNSFELIVEALHIWATEFSNSSDWNIISVGEDHPDIELGNNILLTSMSKLTMDKYAQVLAESYIGISFMISPHPSYPPLEMAHYGIRVLTNKYRNKDLSLLHENIFSIEDTFPEHIASYLTNLCMDFENSSSGWAAKSFMKDFLSDDDCFNFSEDIFTILDSFVIL